MDNKRYQVFVSSTFEDLQVERKEVMQALLELDCIPAGMELFPASNDDQWSLIKKVIDDCDYYLLIIGGRYGSIDEKSGKSYTQMEFEYALSTNKPIISFLHKNPEMIPSIKTEQTPEGKTKLDEFRKLAQKKLVKYWNNPENLGSVISRSMVKLIKDNPAEGWVRAESDETSIREIARLQKENSELKKLLGEVATEAPKGAEKLSQGDDIYTALCGFWCSNKKTGKTYEYTSEVVLKWNEIFSAISPAMIDECTDTTFYTRVCSLVKKKFIQNIPESYDNMKDFRNFSLSNSTIGQIKIQLRALGLIKLSGKKHSTADKGTYWQLTPYGDHIMTQLMAIKK